MDLIVWPCQTSQDAWDIFLYLRNKLNLYYYNGLKPMDSIALS